MRGPIQQGVVVIGCMNAGYWHLKGHVQVALQCLAHRNERKLRVPSSHHKAPQTFRGSGTLGPDHKMRAKSQE
jgi:hypothetical protein